MGKFRDGTSVTPDAVSLILESLDRIKEILTALEQMESGENFGKIVLVPNV